MGGPTLGTRTSWQRYDTCASAGSRRPAPRAISCAPWPKRPTTTTALDDALRLVVSEVVTNSIRHGEVGPDGCVEITVDVDPSRLRLEITDDGPGVRARRHPDPARRAWWLGSLPGRQPGRPLGRRGHRRHPRLAGDDSDRGRGLGDDHGSPTGFRSPRARRWAAREGCDQDQPAAASLHLVAALEQRADARRRPAGRPGRGRRAAGPVEPSQQRPQRRP